MNRDLWEELLIETENKNIEWKKVLGHSGHEYNDRCDEIATSFADGLNVNLYNGSKTGYTLFHNPNLTPYPSPRLGEGDHN